MAPTVGYNLIDEPFVPCNDLHGRFVELSLRDVLLRASGLREIYDESPLVTIALHRLLLAILHRCWSGKSLAERRKQWKQMWEAGRFSTAAIDDYLKQWHARFELFSDDFPFYQTANLKMKEASSLSRLALEEQLTGVLFTHDESPQWQAPSPALAARLVIATQSFALGFGKSSRAVIGDTEIEPPYSADAILLRGVTIWLTGDTLFHTLMLNLVPQAFDPDDAPCWELDNPYDLADKLVKGQRRTSPPRGPMDRFTWQSRLIRLLPTVEEGRLVVRSAYFTQGRSLSKEPGTLDFDPMKAYRSSKKEGYIPVALNEKKAAWRDAHALLKREKDGKTPESFDWISKVVADETIGRRDLYNLHVVGLAAEPGKAGKFLLWRHDRMPVPAAVLQDVDLVSAIETAIQEAEFVAEELGGRIRRVCRLFLAPECETDYGRKPHPDDVTRLANEFDPRRAYWPRLEAPFFDFLRALPDSRTAALDEWLEIVEDHATESFRESAKALGVSPRAVRAVAHVSGGFMTKKSLIKWHSEQAKTKAAKKLLKKGVKTI